MEYIQLYTTKRKSGEVLKQNNTLKLKHRLIFFEAFNRIPSHTLPIIILLLYIGQFFRI